MKTITANKKMNLAGVSNLENGDNTDSCDLVLLCLTKRILRSFYILIVTIAKVQQNLTNSGNKLYNLTRKQSFSHVLIKK